MKEQIAGWLLATLQQATNAVEKGAQFLGDQIPLFVQEFLAFQFWWNLNLAIISFIAFVCMILGYTYKIWGVDDYEADQRRFLGGMILIIPFIVSIGTFVGSLQTVMMIHFAPRVYLIKQFMVFFK